MVIDNKISYASTLIEQFEKSKKYPQIAISVDMLDTGIDVPEVLNLVFFKPVKSKVKFWQMIGRGTRLCENLYGEGNHKKKFYIFDCCRNFEYFEENEKGIETTAVEGLTEKIFNLKLELIMELQKLDYQENEEYVKIREQLIQEFIDAIQMLNEESFIVKAKRGYVEKYSDRTYWNAITTIEKIEIKSNLTPIFVITDTDEAAKRFDNLIYSLELRKLKEKDYNLQTNSIIALMDGLKELGTIEQIKEKAGMIKSVSKKEYWNNATFFEIEEIRRNLRELIKFIENPPRKIWNVNFEDTIIVNDEQINIADNTFEDYKKKVRKFLEGNMDNIVIYKIKHNQLLTELEKSDLERIMWKELGTNKDFVDSFGNTKNVIQVVRSLVGLDREIANSIFAEYINDNRLNSKQIEFVKTLKEYVIENGIISLDKLKEKPFSNIGSIYEIFKDNINVFNEIKENIEQINDSTIKLA
jgi:type I restriction enzyme R subunit